MNKIRKIAIAFSAVLTFFASSFLAAEENSEKKEPEKPVPSLAANGLVSQPDLMVRTKMLTEIDAAKKAWDERFAKLFPNGDLAAYQKERREFFWRQLGELWEKTPLEPQITGSATLEDGVRIEKTILQTLPHFYATGTLFLPDETKFKPPYPAILVVCGHSFNGKACEEYQGLCRLGAQNGLAMYIQDPIDQGERMQHMRDGKPYLSSVAAHNVVGVTSILLGRNAATFEVWDMTRAFDYLQSRPDICPDRLGVAGNSGGGTQSSYFMALDERVAAAAPSCYICSLFGHLTHQNNPQDAEQNIFGQIAFGMDHIDYAIIRAPKPTLLNTKTNDFFRVEDTWPAYRCAKRIYSKCRLAENLSIIEVYGDHGYCPELLEATVRWMMLHLRGEGQNIHCPAIVAFGKSAPEGVENASPAPGLLPLIPENEMRSTENGVMALPEARTTYDLNRDLCRTLAERRREKFANRTAEELAETVRTVAGITPFENIALPEKFDDKNGSGEFFLKPEEGIYLSVRLENAQAADETLTLVVTENGRRSEPVEKIFSERAGKPTACVEVRGWGETQNVGPKYYLHDWFGTDGVDSYYAYLMGKSYVGMRGNDLLATAKFLAQTTGKKIALLADGRSSGIVALHAAASALGVFASVTVPEGIETWSEAVEKAPAPIRLTDTIHGVLNFYDLDDLQTAL